MPSAPARSSVVESPVATAVPPLGALVAEDGVTFRVWSTKARRCEVVLFGPDGCPARRPMEAVGDGLFEAAFDDVQPGARYQFSLDGQDLPDPYARWLPDGPHGAAVVWQSSYAFQHRAPDLRPDQLVIYELHVGTFTRAGTYAAAIEKLPHLADLGVNAIELLPLAAAAGTRGWGYDGVAWFAPFAPYGPPEDLQRFIDAAHGHGMAVLLDAVYNHFGPAGNYLGSYSPQYFTDRKKTPWGSALDYTNPYMRRLALDSVAHWLRTFRFDGLRLDATHEIHDDSPTHFLEELAHDVHALKEELGTTHFLFCEDDRNWPGLVKRFHMDGMWADDFHHQTRILLTGERDSYFAAYEPTVAALANCINRGWTYEGQTWPIGKPWSRGKPATELAASNFVYTIQNHDQIGNRAVGDRLNEKAGPDGFLAAAVLLLCLPMTPLLFQGQEWMASTPFQYFTDHEGELGKAITKGRTEEFGGFDTFKNGGVTVPDPQDKQTFMASKLNWDELGREQHGRALSLHRQLLALRRTDAVLSHNDRGDLRASAVDDVLVVDRRHNGERRVLLVNFGREPARINDAAGPDAAGATALLATQDVAGGMLPPKAAVLLKA